MMSDKRVVVIGGGAAGMMAAVAASEKGCDVTLIEKNEKLGKKIFVTGKGRCNLTNSADTDLLFSNIVSNPKFLYSAIYGFSNSDVCDYFVKNGLKLKEERGGRIFPESDHSSDVIRTLEKDLRRRDVNIKLNEKVTGLKVKNDKIIGVTLSDKSEIKADAVILATGGKSYASTGSTGDGYDFAIKAGHSVKEPVPALCPLIVKEEFCAKLAGLSLKNVEVNIKNGKKKIYSERGEMLFTHTGVSGPLILSASSYINRIIPKEGMVISIDLKPALSEDQLKDRIKRDLNEFSKKEFKNSLSKLLPQSMIPVMIKLSNIDPYKQSAQINGSEIETLARLIKDLKLTVLKTASFDEAIITAGGINVKEINASTMESKLVHGLFIAGEVLDVDALTGGFNLQIAWSTGHLAGSSAAMYTE